MGGRENGYEEQQRRCRYNLRPSPNLRQPPQCTGSLAAHAASPELRPSVSPHGSVSICSNFHIQEQNFIHFLHSLELVSLHKEKEYPAITPPKQMQTLLILSGLDASTSHDGLFPKKEVVIRNNFDKFTTTCQKSSQCTT